MQMLELFTNFRGRQDPAQDPAASGGGHVTVITRWHRLRKSKTALASKANQRGAARARCRLDGHAAILGPDRICLTGGEETLH